MKRREFKIYQEETKQRYVSHWDMDYVPREQLEAVLEPAGSQPKLEGARVEQIAEPATKRSGGWLNRLRHYFDDSCGCQD